MFLAFNLLEIVVVIVVVIIIILLQRSSQVLLDGLIQLGEKRPKILDP